MSKSIKIYLEAGRKGAGMGWKTGLVLAFSYLSANFILGIITSLIADAIHKNLEPYSTNISSIFSFIILYLGVGIAIGILTAVPIGMLTGIILGVVICAYVEFLSRGRSLIMGALVGSILALIVFTVFGSWDGYWMLIGVPSIIYIAACGWMSRKFYDDLVAGVFVANTRMEETGD